MTFAILLVLAFFLFLAYRRVAVVERQVEDLRKQVALLKPAPGPVAAPTTSPERHAAPPRVTPRPRPQRTRRSFDWRPKVTAADLMGAKALAFAGGVVTLLGVIFFFVLVVNRGWIGPELRVGAGALASAIVFGAGLWLQRRYETTYAALAAVGVGVAGAYVTLLAAVSLYDLISNPVALLLAGVIAAVGLTVSLLWSSEIVAAFGLLGAMVVPATLVFQGGLQEIGTAFVAVVFAATAVVAVRKRWWTLLQAGALIGAPQALLQVADAAQPHASIVVLAGAFWLLFLAAGVAFQLRVSRDALAAKPVSFLTLGAAFGGLCAALLYDGTERGVAVLVVAAVYVILAGAFFRRLRELSLVLGMLGLTLGAIGTAAALSGSSLTYAWAADAALLAWLGSRLRDTRFQLPALAYLLLAVTHALAVEARPDHLFEVFPHPAKGAPALVLISLAAIVFARVRRCWGDAPSRGLMRVLDPLLAQLRTHERTLDVAAYALAAVTGAYAASLGILGLAQLVSSRDGSQTAFQWGHVAVTATWSAAALAGIVLALRAQSRAGLALALAALALTAVKALAFDATTLEPTQYGISVAAVGVAALIAGLVRQLMTDRLTVTGVTALVASLGLALGGGLVLWPSGYLVLAIGAGYVALAAATFKRRDLSTVLWSLGLATTAVGAGILLDGTWLVLAYSATAAALAGLSLILPERRLQLASLFYVALAGFWTLVFEAPPANLVSAQPHPGDGVPSLLCVIAATATLAWSLGWNARYRIQTLWVAGTLAVYAASLAILEAAQRLSPGDVHTDFQRGQTAVSALWGILALVSLYAGLKRRRAVLRGGGFILFAISLGKLFLFDLPSLSSAQRALSFLAVGGVLLLGGFFYQRLNAQYDDVHIA